MQEKYGVLGDRRRSSLLMQICLIYLRTVLVVEEESSSFTLFISVLVLFFYGPQLCYTSVALTQSDESRQAPVEQAA